MVLSARFGFIVKLRPGSLELGATRVFLQVIILMIECIGGVVRVMGRRDVTWSLMAAQHLFCFYSVTSIVTSAAIAHQKAILQIFLAFCAIGFLEFFRTESLLLGTDIEMVHILVNTWQKLSRLVLLRFVSIHQVDSIITPLIVLLELVVVLRRVLGLGVEEG